MLQTVAFSSSQKLQLAFPAVSLLKTLLSGQVYLRPSYKVSYSAFNRRHHRFHVTSRSLENHQRHLVLNRVQKLQKWTRDNNGWCISHNDKVYLHATEPIKYSDFKLWVTFAPTRASHLSDHLKKKAWKKPVHHTKYVMIFKWTLSDQSTFKKKKKKCCLVNLKQIMPLTGLRGTNLLPDSSILSG